MPLNIPGQSAGTVGTPTGPLRLPDTPIDTSPKKRQGFFGFAGQTVANTYKKIVSPFTSRQGITDLGQKAEKYIYKPLAEGIPGVALATGAAVAGSVLAPGMVAAGQIRGKSYKQSVSDTFSAIKDLTGKAYTTGSQAFPSITQFPAQVATNIAKDVTAPRNPKAFVIDKLRAIDELHQQISGKPAATDEELLTAFNQPGGHTAVLSGVLADAANAFLIRGLAKDIYNGAVGKSYKLNLKQEYVRGADGKFELVPNDTSANRTPDWSRTKNFKLDNLVDPQSKPTKTPNVLLKVTPTIGKTPGDGYIVEVYQNLRPWQKVSPSTPYKGIQEVPTATQPVPPVAQNLQTIPTQELLPSPTRPTVTGGLQSAPIQSGVTTPAPASPENLGASPAMMPPAPRSSLLETTQTPVTTTPKAQIAPTAPVAPQTGQLPTPPAVVAPKPLKPLPTEIPPTKDYYVQLNDKYVQVVGKPAPIVPTIDTFTSRNANGIGFGLFEGKTGQQIATGKNPNEAIMIATPRLVGNEAKVNLALQKIISENGLSPRYTEYKPPVSNKVQKSPKSETPKATTETATGRASIADQLVAMGVKPEVATKAKPVEKVSTTNYRKPAPTAVAEKVNAVLATKKAGGRVESGVTSKLAVLKEDTKGTEALQEVYSGGQQLKRADLKTLYKNNKEFNANPVLTVENRTIAHGTKTSGAVKVLSFKGETSSFMIRADALGLNSEALSVGEKIRLDPESLKTPGNNIRVINPKGEIMARNVKGGNVITPERIIAAKTTGDIRSTLVDNIIDFRDRGMIEPKLADQYIAEINRATPDMLKNIRGIQMLRGKFSRSIFGKNNPETIAFYDPADQVIAMKQGLPAEFLTHEMLHPTYFSLSEADKAIIQNEWNALSQTEKQYALGGKENYDRYMSNYGGNKDLINSEYLSWQGEQWARGQAIKGSNKLVAIIKKIWEALKRWLSDRPKLTPEMKGLIDKIYSPTSKLSGEGLIPKEMGKFSRLDQGFLSESLQDSFKPNEQKIDIKKIDIPQTRDFLGKDIGIERNVVEKGFNPELTDIIVEKNGDRYRVVTGTGALQGIQRRLAKGLSAPTEVNVIVRGEYKPETDEHKWNRVDPKELKDEGMPDDVVAALEDMQKVETETARELEANPGKVKGLVKFLTGVTHETHGILFQTPHIAFKEIFDPAHEGSRLAGVNYDRDIKLLQHIYQKYNIKPGSKKEDLVWKYREKILSKEEAGQITPEMKEFSQSLNDQWTEPHHTTAVENEILRSTQHVADYVPRGKFKFQPVDKFGRPSVDLTIDPAFAKSRTGELIDPEVPMFEKFRRYAKTFNDKLYLEPGLTDAQTLAKKYYEGIKLDEAMKWLAYVKNPYKLTGTANQQIAQRGLRTTSTLVTQSFSTGALGLRTGVKNILWGLNMTFKDTGLHWFRSMNQMMKDKAGTQKILETEAKNLLDEALPNIYGTFGSNLEGVTKNITKFQRWTPSALFQKVGENFLRQHAYLSYRLQGQKMGLTGQELVRFAHRGVVKSQQIYTAVDLPKAFRGPFGRVIGQFIMPKVKVMNEVLYDVNQGNWGAVARFLIGGLILFTAVSKLLVTGKRRITKDGKKYIKGGIDILEGIDIFDFRKMLLAMPNGVFNMVGMAVEQFYAPIIKMAIHMAGQKVASDQIYNQYKSQGEIVARDLKTFIPGKASVGDILSMMEIYDMKTLGTSSELISTAIGLEKLIKDAKGDQNKIDKLKNTYKDVYPYIGLAKSTDSQLSSLSSSMGDKKAKIKKQTGLTDAEKKQKIADITKETEDKRNALITKFNATVFAKLKQ